MTILVLAAWTSLVLRSTESATARRELLSPRQEAKTPEELIPGRGEPSIVRTPLNVAIGDNPLAASQPVRWKNPKRDRAEPKGIGLYGQKYHPTIVPLETFGDALVAALESSPLFNPEKIVLTAEERQALGQGVGELAGKFEAAKKQASDIVEAAFQKKREAGEFAETYAAGAKFPKIEEVMAKYQGGRDDRILSLDWRDGGFAVVVLTLEECPGPFEAKLARGAAYDAIVEYLFSFFEDATNRRRM